MRHIITDAKAIDVFEEGTRLFRAEKGELETIMVLHEALPQPLLLGKLAKLPQGVWLKALTLMSHEQSIVLHQDDQNFTQALDWLATDGWAIDEALGRSFRTPDMRTHVNKQKGTLSHDV